MQTSIDFAAVARRARAMSVEALRYSAEDAREAAEAAEAIERAGWAVTGKTGGYYRDEAGVYRTELRRRGEL